MERLKILLEHLPFVAATTQSWPGQRIIEALIIAAMTATGTAYITAQRVETQMGYIEKRVDDLVTDVREIRRELLRQGQKK